MMIYLFDFNDSFTFNIYSQLKLIDPNLEINIITYENSIIVLEELVHSTSKSIIIFGPGPGHPGDYELVSKFIPKILDHPSLFFMGICLGHQLLWHAKGVKVEICKKPIHGQVCEYELEEANYFRDLLELKNPKIKVQRYNSLCVLESEFRSQINDPVIKSFFYDKELIMSGGHNFLTYQFHPESVGTTCPSSYFTPILDFLL